MPRILSITSSRADIGILTPIWRALAARSDIELHVLETGMHCSAGSPAFDLPVGTIRHVGGRDIGGRGPAEASRAMAAIAVACSRVIEAHSFDILLAAGDRLDMLPALIASVPFNIPIAHLHGGELTYGAIDDRVRHVASKLAHLHFTSSTAAAKRLAAMGEETWRIHVTGAPGLDTLRLAPQPSPEEFAQKVGLRTGKGYLLATVHPETNSDDPLAPMHALVSALQDIQIPVLISAPNSDPNGQLIRKMAVELAAARPDTVFVETLGDLYASAIRLAAAVVGNSSSGLLEAAFFGTPALNIGDRQAGREADPSVHHVPNDAGKVLSALSDILHAARGRPGRTVYGDGYASERIAGMLEGLPSREKLLAKRFSADPNATFPVPWEEPGPT